MPDRILKPDWPSLPDHIVALTTVRSGGVSQAPYDDGTGNGGFNLATHVGDQPDCVRQNRALLSGYLPSAPCWLDQVHGSRVTDVGKVQTNFRADACLTTSARVVCAVQTADCLPVLFCDVKTNVVAAAHAGWRGLVNGVLEETLAAMLRAGAETQNILAWMGPAIGPGYFEVGAEVRSQFIDADPCAVAAFKLHAKKVHTNNSDKYDADIYQLARLRLHRAGVFNISGGGYCTVSEPEKFYSYRRDGITGRMASLIWIK